MSNPQPVMTWTCEWCGHVATVPDGDYDSLPHLWKKINFEYLCSPCGDAYQDLRLAMQEKKD